MLHKMMGCNQDHAAEIDIFNKSYKEKMQRITMMKEQGNAAMKSLTTDNANDMLQKASYYYQQA